MYRKNKPFFPHQTQTQPFDKAEGKFVDVGEN